MRVNSVFTGLFTYRLVVRSGIPIAIAIVMLAIFFIASSFTERSDRDFRAKHVNLIIRQIGHQLLLQSGDQTSRVMPVTEVKEGTFRLEFENELAFDHDSLMVLALGLLPKTQFTSGYAVTVLDCQNAGIVYGFQVSNSSRDVLPCGGRSQPTGCYTIEFSFPDFYADVEEKKVDTYQPTEKLKSATVEPQKINVKPEELKTTTLDHDIHPLTEEPESFNVDPKESNSKPNEFTTTTVDSPFTNLVYGGMVVLLVVAFLVGRFGKSLIPVPVQIQDSVAINEFTPIMPALGKFLMDAKDQRLLLGSEVISLTDKEFKILELLHKSFGELIPRETLMQEVWINEGVITGRSLDMFVSKLRKKLSGDPELRITNVHGKGYKLEIS